MAIICDCCGDDITPTDDIDGLESPEREILKLNGKTIALCFDCFNVLSEWACSPEHLKKTKEYRKEFQ